MQVTIIGSGNVGTVLGRVLKAKGHVIRQVFSRLPVHAHALAAELHAAAVSDLLLLDSDSDIYILAITDDALPRVATQVCFGNKLVIHTAGSVSKDVLRPASSQYGVMWPMKMIRKQVQELGEISIVIDGNSETVIDQLRQLAGIFSKNVSLADDVTRLKMHMLATVTSNFTNHLYHLAADYCGKEGIDFSLFYPIINDTVARIQTEHPSAVQAGPAFRGDMDTIARHAQLLNAHPDMQSLYMAISRSIMANMNR